MVRVVVDDRHPRRARDDLEPAPHAAKGRQAGRDRRKVEPGRPCDGDRGERVLHVHRARHLQGHRPRDRALDDGVEARAETGVLHVARRDRRVAEAERHRARAAPAAREHRRPRLVGADDGDRAGGQRAEERLERADQFLERLVAVDVVVLHVEHDRDLRPQVEERSVGLVALGHEPRTGSGARVGSGGDEFPADDDRRIEPRMLQDATDHRGRRRLAVRPGDRDAAAGAHQFGQ